MEGDKQQPILRVPTLASNIGIDKKLNSVNKLQSYASTVDRAAPAASLDPIELSPKPLPSPTRLDTLPIIPNSKDLTLRKDTEGAPAANTLDDARTIMQSQIKARQNAAVVALSPSPSPSPNPSPGGSPADLSRSTESKTAKNKDLDHDILAAIKKGVISEMNSAIKNIVSEERREKELKKIDKMKDILNKTLRICYAREGD